MLLFATNPPAGLIPRMPASQADRANAFLAWAEALGGCGLTTIREILMTVLEPR